MKQKLTITNSLITLFTFFVHYSFTQTTLFQGQVGDFPIHLEIDLNKEQSTCTGYYFYDRQLKHIPLSGSISENEITLTTSADQEGEKETISLIPSIYGFQGTWQKKNMIYPMYIEPYEDQKDFYFETYSKSNLEYEHTEFTDSLIWMKEKHSGVSLFRLTNVFDEETKQWANSVLDSIHMQAALLQFQCESQTDFDLQFLDENMLSISEEYGYYCHGAAHPNYGITGHTLDIKNKKVYQQLSDLIGHNLYIQYIQAKYKDDDFESDYLNDCDPFSSASINYWEFANWYQTKDGLQIIPSYPHVLTPCALNYDFLLSHDEIEYLQTVEKPDYTGRWSWQNEQNTVSLDITFNEYDGQYYVKYCSVFQNGKKVDCSEYQRPFPLWQESDGYLTGEFSSASWKGSGTISFSYDLITQSLWVETYDTDGEFYLPAQAKFSR